MIRRAIFRCGQRLSRNEPRSGVLNRRQQQVHRESVPIYSGHSREQPVPRTTDRALKPNGRGDQDVRFSRFNFLQRPDIEVNELGKMFLSQLPRHAFAANVRSENRNLLGEFAF